MIDESGQSSGFGVASRNDTITAIKKALEGPIGQAGKESSLVLRPLHEAVNTRSHVKLSPSQASRILTLDMNGNAVTDGDTIVFSYGIPPVRVEAKLTDRDGEVWAMTPGHKPDRLKLKELQKHVGEYYKLEHPREQTEDPTAKWDRRTALSSTGDTHGN